AAIMTPIDGATAASPDPMASATSVTTKIRSLPIMSPTRPRIGVVTDADGRYAVSTHVAVSWDVCNCSCTVVSTGTTSDCNSAYAPTPAASTANVTRLCRPGGTTSRNPQTPQRPRPSLILAPLLRPVRRIFVCPQASKSQTHYAPNGVVAPP